MHGGPLQLCPSVTFCTQTGGRKSRMACRSGPSNIDPEKPPATFRDVSVDRQQLMFYSELCANVTETRRCFAPVVLVRLLLADAFTDKPVSSHAATQSICRAGGWMENGRTMDHSDRLWGKRADSFTGV